MNVYTTYYHKFESDEKNRAFKTGQDSESVTTLILEIPEGVTISADFNHYALNIPKLKNLQYLKIIVDGKIEGAGGLSNGGGIVNWNPVDAVITGKGRIRGGGANTGALRMAIKGRKDLTQDPPRIFNF